MSLVIQRCGHFEIANAPPTIGPAGESSAGDVAQHRGAADAETSGDVGDEVAREVRR